MTHPVEKILEEPLASDAGGVVLFDLTPVATLVLGPNGAVRRANAAAHALFHCIAGELVGTSAALLFPELWSGGGRSVEVGVDPPRRVTARRPDGVTFAARLTLVPFGATTGAAVLATVEDLRALEEELAASAAQVLAANKAFEAFIDAAAHDLRAPLRILSGFADALEDECGDTLTGDGKTFLGEILKSSKRMDGLIDGLLTLARCGRAEMTCENLDFSTLVELVFYELRHADDNRTVECTVAPELRAWGDVRLVMTVLRNLLGNAWKFTGRTAAPMVRVYSQVRAGRTWICVSDNGAGFDMAHAERLFKPFTRFHRQDEFGGHGLGLATVHRILQRHHGAVEAESTVGEGTTVRLLFGPAPD